MPSRHCIQSILTVTLLISFPPLKSKGGGACRRQVCTLSTLSVGLSTLSPASVRPLAKTCSGKIQKNISHEICGYMKLLPIWRLFTWLYTMTLQTTFFLELSPLIGLSNAKFCMHVQRKSYFCNNLTSTTSFGQIYSPSFSLIQ